MGKVETGDMDKLIAAVDAGSIAPHDQLWLHIPYSVDPNGWIKTHVPKAQAAYNGSLDAAKRLHDALLPGWRWSIQGGLANVWPELHQYPLYAGIAPDNPARAWLLAVLRAVKSLPGNGASNATTARIGSGDA